MGFDTWVLWFKKEAQPLTSVAVAQPSKMTKSKL